MGSYFMHDRIDGDVERLGNADAMLTSVLHVYDGQVRDATERAFP